MSGSRQGPALDRFRLLAAVLVVCNHTGPLDSLSPTADFFLTRVLARLAVPFFFIVSGYFLAKGQWKHTGRFLRKTLLLYLAAVALYLPLNWYNGGYSPLEWVKKLLADGTLYHLWYFPAVLLGVVVARNLARLPHSAALGVAAVLYLIGVGGDSWYGLVSQAPALEELYGGIFQVFDYTRNGLFFAPLSLLLGCNRGRDQRAARLSLLVYLLHPWSIVLVRGGAEVLGLEGILVRNSLGHFCAVLVLTACMALVLDALRPIRPNPKGRAWRELDRGALVHNAQVLQDALAPGCRLMAVVKADAYGHGAVPVARCLQKAGVNAFAVACLAEGIRLRKAGIRGTILILGYTPAGEVPLLRRWRLTQMVADEAHGQALAGAGGRVRVHLALDTGMRRLGVPAEDHNAIARLYRLRNLNIQGVFSHLCVSDSLEPENTAYTQRQLNAFYNALDWMRSQGLDPGKVHIQASYGIWDLPPQPCAYARAGIALYGVQSAPGPVRRDLDLRPVLSLRARVASVRTLAPGECAGYGLAFHARRETKLAVVTIGYADGLPRCLPQQGGRVLLLGQFCPMVGRMCMDQLLVDVTDVPGVRPGDVATLLGAEGGNILQAEELATRCGTITNELLSRLGPRLELV